MMYDMRTSGLKSFESKQVQVVIEFAKIGTIDTMNEKYEAEFNIESRWTGVEVGHLETYDSHKHWNPQLYIENALQLSKEEVSYQVEKTTDGVLWVVEKRHVKGKQFTGNSSFEKKRINSFSGVNSGGFRGNKKPRKFLNKTLKIPKN